MPVELPASWDTLKEESHAALPWLFLWQLVIDEQPDLLPNGDPNPTPSTWVQLVRNNEEVSWTGLTFDPFPIAHSPIVTPADGKLVQISVTIPNVSNWLLSYLEQSQGFIGNRASVFLVHAANLASDQFLAFHFQVATGEVNEQAITLRLERPNWLSENDPEDRVSVNSCSFEFGGPKCGYIRNAVAAFQTCGKTLSDCTARGLDELARNLPVLHPRRFGAEPAVPVQRVA